MGVTKETCQAGMKEIGSLVNKLLVGVMAIAAIGILSYGALLLLMLMI